MNQSHLRLVSFFYCTVAVVALMSVSVPAFSPKSTPSPTQDSSSEIGIRNTYISLLERLKDDAIRRDKIMKEFYEDFQQIQLLNMQLSNAFKATAIPDYALVSKETAEVGKHATRLKHNLMLPPSKRPDEKVDDVKEVNEKDQVRAYVRSLNLLTMSFVSSSLFKKDVKIDYQDIGKARRDLDGIIEFSEKAQKTADLLSKGKTK